MNYNYQKRQYKAIALQLQEDNFEEAMSLINQNGAEPHQYGDNLMVRFSSGDINTIRAGSWIVVGENGDVKLYNNDVFHIKYEALP